MADPSTCYFGKLPIQGDFIRLNSKVPELGQLDTWIQEGIYQSRQGRGREWDGEFDQVGTTRFVYQSPASKGLLTGVCRASSDSAGRRYPFVLAARSPELSREEFGLLPLEALAFQEQADALANQGWQDGDISKFQDRARRVTWQRDPAAAQGQFLSWLEASDSESFWNEILPGSSPARRAAFLFEFEQVLVQRVAPRFVLRLPAGESPATLAVLLTLVTIWAVDGRSPNLTLWHGQGQAEPSVLCLLFDDLAGRYFDPLFWPGRPSKHAYELAHDRQLPDEQQAAADGRFGAAVGATSKLSDLLSTLQEVGA